MGYYSKYWSSTKLASWIRGTPKPSAATSAEWKEWHMMAKANHPFRYWVAEEALDYLQDVVNAPINWAKGIQNYVINRWVNRSHALTSSTLEKGKYHEIDTRILHCLFDELVNFVEIESAWMHVVFDDDAWKRYRAYKTFPFRLKRWRSREAGLDHLEWESSLRVDESWGISKDDPRYATLTDQAVGASEILELYRWWTEIRPSREDPYVTVGLCDEDRNCSNKRSDKEQERLYRLVEIEKGFDDEDDEMLMRLIKLRRSLWT